MSDITIGSTLLAFLAAMTVALTIALVAQAALFRAWTIRRFQDADAAIRKTHATLDTIANWTDEQLHATVSQHTVDLDDLNEQISQLAARVDHLIHTAATTDTAPPEQERELDLIARQLNVIANSVSVAHRRLDLTERTTFDPAGYDDPGGYDDLRPLGQPGRYGRHLREAREMSTRRRSEPNG